RLGGDERRRPGVVGRVGGRVGVPAPVAPADALVVGHADQHPHEVGAVGARPGVAVGGGGAEEGLDLGLAQVLGGRAAGRVPEVVFRDVGLPVQGVHLDVGQDAGQPAPVRADPVVLLVGDQGVDREGVVGVVVVVDRQGDLLEVVGAGGPGG